MSASGWIGVDFDGTLSEYHGYVPGRRFGPPIGPMLARVFAWLAAGVTVKIVTARAADPDEARAIQDWCEAHGLPRLEVTDRKDYSMVELWDDRAVRVISNTGRRRRSTRGEGVTPAKFLARWLARIPSDMRAEFDAEFRVMVDGYFGMMEKYDTTAGALGRRGALIANARRSPAERSALAQKASRARWRAASAEPGTSLRGAGFAEVGRVSGRSWSCASRPRVDRHPTQEKIRWELTA